MRAFLGCVSVVLLALVGCEQRPPEKPVPVFNQQCDYMVVSVVDVSGSYLDILETRGFPLLLATCDQYFSARVGANDRLVLARVSGSERSLLWDGPPMSLRESFGSAAAFRAFLEKHAGGGSRVYDSVADAATYCLDFPGVAHEKTCLMVLSDMEDNFPDSAQSKARMLKALSAYAKKGGTVGFYFVGQREVAGLRQDLAACGFKHLPVVESEIVVNPALPTFGE